MSKKYLVIMVVFAIIFAGGGIYFFMKREDRILFQGENVSKVVDEKIKNRE